MSHDDAGTETAERGTGTHPLRIGLTGGIAAGKSTAASRFAQLGAVVIDADLLAREAVAAGSPGLARVVEEFGPEVLNEEGSLDRQALGAIVFGDDEARARLNGIVHPEVRRLSAERERQAFEAGERVIVHDIPLLIEVGRAQDFDLLVVVHTPAEVRRRRLIGGRGSSAEEADRRIAAQASDDERVTAADVLLDGAGGVEDLRAQVDELWRERVVAEPA
ncbi:dephospho-CoA kinase [Bogoriella caseilytica]|uniref:Dephospho-CoA kinase n=1 Tax=Bogoriella caseilytica TaxID=56055 RepID=A0A3N2BH03_9MICO|nr:dephospho-CoA kinase [Bogoriella caseilytica]ROR74498.1 dephospho-CoA kinase [Bogoriella caseilytica]